MPDAPPDTLENDHRPNGRDDGYLAGVGARVRALRARRGMSRKILAHDSNVSERYLGQLEAGQGNVSIVLLRRIADAMSVGIVDLLSEETDRPFEHKMILELLDRLSDDQIEEVRKLLTDRFASAADNNRQARIALVGLRGSGKTTLGRALAHRRGVPFINMADEIEALSGMSLTEIFSLSGQRAYRRFERQALERVLSDHRAAVIETGGSLVSEPASLAALLECCTTVWIKTSPEEHVARVVAQGDHRPLAGPSEQVMEDLRQILAERGPLYARADFTIDTTGKSAGDALDELMAALPGQAR